MCFFFLVIFLKMFLPYSVHNIFLWGSKKRTKNKRGKKKKKGNGIWHLGGGENKEENNLKIQRGSTATVGL